MARLETRDKIVETGSADSADDVNQYLTFSVSGENLAMSIEAVKEIIETPQVTRVPMTPDYIRGVINLRGSVVPVIDLGARLGRGPLTLTKRSCIVLAEVLTGGDRHFLGMLVDEVNNILDIPQRDVKPAPEFGSEIRTDFIAAMGRIDDVFVIILSIDHVLSMQELAALRRMSEEVSSHGQDAES